VKGALGGVDLVRIHVIGKDKERVFPVFPNPFVNPLRNPDVRALRSSVFQEQHPLGTMQVLPQHSLSARDRSPEHLDKQLKTSIQTIQ
jgi:hypothetical protein